MSVSKKHPSVNWIDGMKINREHLVYTENYFVSQMCETFSSHINAYNYGLLPSVGSDQSPNDFTVENTATREVEIILKSCDAITLSGLRITIDASSFPEGLKYTTAFSGSEAGAQEADKTYFLVITINPFQRQPFGELDPEEVPPRHPYTMPKIALALMEEAGVSKDTTGGYFLIVGRVTRTSKGFYKDESFIPPCASIRSHILLINHYNTFGSVLNEVQVNAFSIVQKIKNRQQKSDLALHIRMLCEALLQYVAQSYFSFRNIAHQQPPIYTVENFSSLANVIYTCLNTMSEKDKEEMLKYFYEWCDVMPSNLESQLTTCVGIRYDHLNIGKTMEQVQQLLTSLALIMGRLNTLEYIGQHKENLVVKEETMQTAKKEKTGWSILD
jgi:hypothetical protein